MCVVWIAGRGDGVEHFLGSHHQSVCCFCLQVHPLFPDPIYIFHRLLHPCGRGEQDASAGLASDGAQQPLLLVSGFCPLSVGKGQRQDRRDRDTPSPGQNMQVLLCRSG